MLQHLAYEVLNPKLHAVAAFFFLPSFAVELLRNVQNGVTNSDLGLLCCHSEFISESILLKMLKLVQHDRKTNGCKKVLIWDLQSFLWVCVLNKDLFIFFLWYCIRKERKRTKRKKHRLCFARIIGGHPRTPVHFLNYIKYIIAIRLSYSKILWETRHFS